VFGANGRPVDVNRLGRLLNAGNTDASAPAQRRDPALLLIGYAAGLRTGEAIHLRQRDVDTHDRGLVVSIRGRRRLTYLPSAPAPAYDPAAAWSSWLEQLEANGLRHPDGLAFHATNFSVIFEKGLAEVGVNRLVHQRAEEAGLTGRFAWTSLRSGMIRAAVRDGMSSHVIASHSDLVSLGSVQRHERRETLLGDRNVAGKLGL
jgi:site-specific recombinase XerD